jgi:hypothetical protein
MSLLLLLVLLLCAHSISRLTLSVHRRVCMRPSKERITFMGWPAVRLLLAAGFELAGTSSSGSSSSSGSDFPLGPTSVLPWIERLSVQQEQQQQWEGEKEGEGEGAAAAHGDGGGAGIGAGIGAGGGGGGGFAGAGPSSSSFALDALMRRAMAPIEVTPLVAGMLTSVVLLYTDCFTQCSYLLVI